MIDLVQTWYERCVMCDIRNAFTCKDLTARGGTSKRVIMQCGKCRSQWKGLAPALCSYHRDKPHVVTGLFVPDPF